MTRLPAFLFSLSLCLTATPLSAEPRDSTLLDQLLEGIRTGAIQLVDLSHTLEKGIPFFPGGDGFELIPKYSYESYKFYANRFTMGEHTGTHMDAPIHYAPDREAIHELPLDRMMAPASVLDIRTVSRGNPDYELSREDILRWEEVHGRIPDGSIVLLLTGWSEFWHDPPRYVRKGEDGSPHFPGLSGESAVFLRDERNILGVGTDALSVDAGKNRNLVVHHTFHAAGKFHLENLDHLDKLPPTGSLLMVFPLPIKDGSGAPVRAVALVPRES